MAVQTQQQMLKQAAAEAPLPVVAAKNMRYSAAGGARNSQYRPKGTSGQISQQSLRKFNRELRIKESGANKTNALMAMFVSPINVMLICFPLGIAASKLHWDPMWCFWLNFFALMPLAKILGDATEELDANLQSPVISGLINATLGNAVEMIITVAALQKGLNDVVKASLLGSVLSNMLLVLGMSYFCGGVLGQKADGSFGLVLEKQQSFPVNGALCSISMLLLSCMGFALPTVFANEGETPELNAMYRSHIQELSIAGSLIMTVSYVAYLMFQLVTHKDMFKEGEDEAISDICEDTAMVKKSCEEQEEHISLEMAIGILAGVTILTAFTSELLVDSVDEITKMGLGLSKQFIGIILLPFVGNACEHMAAVRFAVAEKPGLAVSIAVGSSTQIAMFVVPFSVLVGKLVGPPDVPPMDLDFGMLNTTVMILSVIIVMSIITDGRSNWLEGWLLMASFAFVAVMYWFVQDPPEVKGMRIEL